MIILKKHKKLIVISSIVIASIVLLILIAQFIIGNILQSKLENSLANREEGKYNIDIGNVKLNLFTMTLILKDVHVIPDTTLIDQLKQKQAKQNIAIRLNIPTLRVRNIGLFDFIFYRQVDVGSFILKDAEIVLFNAGKSTPKSEKTDEKSDKFNIDSIVLPGLEGVNLNKFSIINLALNVIDINNNDTVFFISSFNLLFKNIALIKNESDTAGFNLVLKDIDLHMSDEQFRLPGGKYLLSFNDMSFNSDHALLAIKKLKIKPLYGRSKMVSMSKYQDEIFDCELEKVEIHSLYPADIIRNSIIILSHVAINRMKLNIFKDKHLPFNTEKRPKLPQQLLKSLKQDLYIGSLIINESELVYSEQHIKMEEPMTVTLGDFNVKVSNITSITDSIAKGIVMAIKLQAKLQNKIPLGINLFFPMKSVADTFSFNGWLGNGDMKLFNPIVLPAIGLKFENGILDGIKFNAQANPEYAIGDLMMLYHNLEGNLVKSDIEETNKLLTWLADKLIIANNPSKDKDKRTVHMFFDRVMYKGLGNFVWKTLQSGISATIIPGMDKKVLKDINTKLGIDKETAGKKTRQRKRKKLTKSGSLINQSL
ncbi:MAG: hypothetical protein H8E34_13600 [Bacteroidetes bacterium]|nr:hypothetical protein [Bacteroidota bacterium]MBL6944411.1 hypothetical protein [Bacteroidales bacterium]